ncbi:MAG: hypothetical protein VXY12_09485 [Pseudomonadota bacterium]|nr:hypothetical protein [Pseudomonadota bacterium]|tara:strand:- start:51 stop:467 length:417 start_codon:yes stop_codon:yes gene_type:complete
MAPGKSVFHRLALKKKVALARKQQAVKTLQEELDRTTGVRDQIAEMAESMNVPIGETTIQHLRSASWYGNQIQEQLRTISNRADFLTEEVTDQRRDMAMTRNQHERAVQKSTEFDRRQSAEREARREASMPPRRSPSR